MWNCVCVSGSVRNSAEKVEGPGTRGAESANDSKEEEPYVASTLSSLFAGLPALAGPQRLANSLRQKFANNSGKFTNFPSVHGVPLAVDIYVSMEARYDR